MTIEVLSTLIIAHMTSSYMCCLSLVYYTIDLKFMLYEYWNYYNKL